MSPERKALILSGPQFFNSQAPLSARITRCIEYLNPLGPAIVSAYLREAGYKTKYEQMRPGKIHTLEGPIESAEVVLISSRYVDTSLAQEAIRLANSRKRQVIVGGYGPTFNEKAFRDADTVVKGEFEPVAGAIIEGLMSNTLAPVYDSMNLPPFDMKGYTYPDRTIFPRPPRVYEHFYMHTQEWSRGCGNKCDFCIATRMQRGGKEVRYRDAGDIINEIKAIGLKPRDNLFCVDLNISAIPEEVLYPLFSYLKDNQIQWYAEGTVAPLLTNLKEKGSNDSLLKLMSAADGKGGCYSFLYGAEDLDSGRIKGSKDKELGIIEEANRVFSQMGIPLNLSLVVGFDQHKYPDTFFAYAQAIRSLRNPYAFIHIVTPYQNTFWGNQIEKEGRIIDKETIHYNHRRVVFNPAEMTASQLQQGYYWLLRTTYRPSEIKKTIRANLDPELLARNPRLGTIGTGVVWATNTYLTNTELVARGHVNVNIQRELDDGYKEWLKSSG